MRRKVKETWDCIPGYKEGAQTIEHMRNDQLLPAGGARLSPSGGVNPFVEKRYGADVARAFVLDNPAAIVLGGLPLLVSSRNQTRDPEAP